MDNGYFVSWSGGKDSCLAMQKAINSMGRPASLVTMLIENGLRSRSHGLRREVLEAQSLALGIPIMFKKTSWPDYEQIYAQALFDLKNHNINLGVFGDIKIAADPNWNEHRSWADLLCEHAQMTAVEPLWELSEPDIEREFLLSQIDALIVAVKETSLDKKYLGQRLDRDLFDDFRKSGVHPLGERGEYHTLVVNSPLFNHPIKVHHGSAVNRDGYWFLDVDLIND